MRPRALGAAVSVDHGLAATLPPLNTTSLPTRVSTRVPSSSPERDRFPEPTVAGVWTATGLERQVFLDRSGRRRRHISALGALLAVLAGAWLAALVTGSVGFSSLPALPSATANVHGGPVVHLQLAPPGRRVAGRDRRRRAYKVADVGRRQSAKGRAGQAFGHLSRQLELD